MVQLVNLQQQGNSLRLCNTKCEAALHRGWLGQQLLNVYGGWWL
jgi:hypothetical protein